MSVRIVYLRRVLGICSLPADDRRTQLPSGVEEPGDRSGMEERAGDEGFCPNVINYCATVKEEMAAGTTRFGTRATLPPHPSLWTGASIVALFPPAGARATADGQPLILRL